MLEIALPIVVIGLALSLAWPLGRYMHWAMDPLNPGPVRQGYERLCTCTLGRATEQEQTWKHYVFSMLAFNLAMFALVYLILTLQGALPLNPPARSDGRLEAWVEIV